MRAPDAADEVVPDFDAWATEIAAAMEPGGEGLEAAPSSLRAARRLARLLDKASGAPPGMIAAFLAGHDRLIADRIGRLEAWARSPLIERLRQRAGCAPG